MSTPSPSTCISRKYNIFPIDDPDAYEAYVRLECSVWSAFELAYTDDISCYKKLKENDSTGNNKKMKRLIDYFLGFVLPSDGIVCDNIIQNFINTCTTFSEKLFYLTQCNQEGTHAVTYGLTVETLIPEPQEQERIRKLVDNLPCLKATADLMEKYKNIDIPLAERHVAFACAEGIFFCVLFNIIFWFKTKNMFKNLVAANRLISLDESAHAKFQCNRYKRCKNKNSARTLEIVKEFVETQRLFIEVMLPEPIEDLTSECLTRYLYTVGDNILGQLGESRYYNSTYAPSWMGDINLNVKVNGFEDITTAYNRFSVDDVLNIDKLTGKTTKLNAIDNTDEIEF
jgi:ribonucleotide reductase beta subunit family protein with ferritin-like domain